MKQIDVIAIGAINYDYMFNGKKRDFLKFNIDICNESLDKPMDVVEREITEFIQGKKILNTQIGGSAFLTLKTIKSIDNSLSVAYVGVCGELNEFDKRYGSITNVKREIDFIDVQDWLFFTDDTINSDNRYIGKSRVLLQKNTRADIKIASGANKLLLDFIKAKEINENQSFTQFLAQAKWIHISSLFEFEAFEKIMEYVIQAKRINKYLKISIDPGSEYTVEKRNELQKYLQNSDYVFLNQNEFDHIIIDKDVDNSEKYIKLSTYFNYPIESRTKIFIVKHKNRHELIDFINGVPYVFYHKKMSFFQIYNDTGAGDCFAGGFIAGILSDRLLGHQPAAIDLGVLAARTRMSTQNNSSVFTEIQRCSEQYFIQKYKNGRYSFKKKIIYFLKSNYATIITFITGFITSIIIDYIRSLLGI